MRLIDADAFLKKNAVFADLDFHHPLYENTLRDLIDDAPTVDVVPVSLFIRCNNCKWRGDDAHCPMAHMEESYSEDDGWDYWIKDNTCDDGFCHLGEMEEQ